MSQNKYAEKYTTLELMAAAGARELKDREVAIAGVGLPMVSAVIAKYTHAPSLKILYELGIYDPQPIHTAIGIADPRAWYRSACTTNWVDIMGMLLMNGRVDVGFLSGIQVDQYGNINSTLRGTTEKILRRFTGSGGANDIASAAKKVIIIMRHEKRRFSAQVDYITSPGYIDGPDGRTKAGLLRGGPSKILTDMAVLGFDEKTKRVKLLSVHPEFTVQDVVKNTGFDLVMPKKVAVTEPPTKDEQRIIRIVADTTGIYTKWKRQD